MVAHKMVILSARLSPNGGISSTTIDEKQVLTLIALSECLVATLRKSQAIRVATSAHLLLRSMIRQSRCFHKEGGSTLGSEGEAHSG